LQALNNLFVLDLIEPDKIEPSMCPIYLHVFGSVRFLWPLALLLGVLVRSSVAFASCDTITVPASGYSSWDSRGIQNTVSIEEHRYPDSLAGKGPSWDPNSPAGELKLSDNVLAFRVPQVTGTVVAAELRLQIRYLVSLRGAEIYQWHQVTNARVRLHLRQMFGAEAYEDSDDGTVYGQGVVSVSEGFATISLNQDFISTLVAASGRTIFMAGSLASLDNDPYNPDYLNLETGAPMYAVLALSLTNSAPPALLNQPVDRAVPAGWAVDFHVLACGASPLSYQWSFNGASLSGATNADLLLPNAGPPGDYRVTVSNVVGMVTSEVAVLQVTQNAPYLVVNPPNQTIDAGRTNVYLRSLAGGAPLPTYRWWFNGNPIEGATNNLLRFGRTTPAIAGSYTVVASNSSGSVTSNPALVTVVPFFMDGPNDALVLLGNEGFLAVYNWGASLPTSCRWFHDGVEIVGEPNCSLDFLATADDAGNYQVIGANEYGSVTSRIAVVTVVRQAPVFFSRLYDQTFVAGLSNSLLTGAAAGPPAVFFWYHDGVLIPSPYSATLPFESVLPSDAGRYSVIASNELGLATNGPAIVSVTPASVFVGPSISSVGAGSVAIFQAFYTGVRPVSFQWFYNPNPAALTNPTLFDGHALEGETNSYLLFPEVSPGQVGFYAVAVSNTFGSVTSAPASLFVSSNSLPFASGETAVQESRVGDFLWITRSIAGSPPPACQWTFNGVELPGRTNYTLALSNVSTQDSGGCSIVLSNGSGAPTAWPTTIVNVTASGPLDDWTLLNPRPQANPLKAVAFGNGRRVSVGENGAVLVSMDGQTWAAHHLGKGIHLHAVAFGNGVFAAAGHADSGEFDLPVILSSPDGWTWTARDLSVVGRLTGIAFGNDHFVAVGAWDYFNSSVPVTLTSSDGAAWVKHYLGGYGMLMSAVCFGNGRFVGVNGVAAFGAPSVFSSSDGVAWTQGQASGERGYHSVWFGGGLFVAVGDSGAVARSQDGFQWTEGLIDSTAPLNAITYGNGVYVAAGVGGAAYLSGDAVSWRPIPLPSTHDISGLVFSEGKFTAVGDAGRILVSADGQAWNDQCLGPDADLYAIVQGPDSLVAVGDGAILNSEDGTNWTQINSTRKLHGLTYGNGLFVAVGKKGLILTSGDGLNWTTRSISATGYLEHVVWATNRFVAVGEAGLMATSTNGLTWRVLPAITPADLEDAAYGNGRFVAVGGYFDLFGAVATVLTSEDGEHWKDQVDPEHFGVRARGVTFANGQFVLVGNDGLIATSPNGVIWPEQFVGNDNLRAVAFAAGHFVAVGNNGSVLSSLDGADWTTNRCPASMNLRDIAVTSETLLVVGSNGAIWKSGEIRSGLRARLIAGGLEIRVEGGLLPGCRVQASTDLSNWTDLFLYTPSAPVTFLDPIGHGVSAGFYRVVPR